MVEQNQQYEEQLGEKKLRLRNLLQPFYDDKITVFRSHPVGYRMRAEFRVWHDDDDLYHIMFDQTTKEKYKVETFPAACDLINQAMQVILPLLKVNETLRRKLFQIDYLATTSGELLISLLYHRQLDEDWVLAAEKLKQGLDALGAVNIIGRARKQKIIIHHDFVTETLSIHKNDYTFVQIENSFTQPNAIINQCMIEWAIENLSGIKGDLLELYCGAGNFSIPLSKHFTNVLGTEISKTSVNAAQKNIQNNNIKNLRIARLSSEEFVEAFNQTRIFRRLDGLSLSNYNFSTVLVDPPRAGIDLETIELIRQFDHILYISCNPITLADNLKLLNNTHIVSSAALFDQFPLTPHIESGVLLKKIK